jgi:multisubunit Na+/H+ antiporter MnhE subunit
MQTFHIKNDIGGHYASVNIMYVCVYLHTHTHTHTHTYIYIYIYIYIADLNKSNFAVVPHHGVYRDTEVICYTVMY